MVVKYQELEKCSYRLNWKLDSDILTGSSRQKPLAYYLQTGYDILFYLQLFVTKIKMHFDAIEFSKADTIENFKQTLEFPEEFNFLVKQFIIFMKLLEEKT